MFGPQGPNIHDITSQIQSKLNMFGPQGPNIKTVCQTYVMSDPLYYIPSRTALVNHVGPNIETQTCQTKSDLLDCKYNLMIGGSVQCNINLNA